MAFNFNWSPLIADTSRARDMLTVALNKSPKPPIIVDDILVTELNLGTTAPELEILEIGDLAEDRFRGIFKMSYTGDAFLTLKTKVQANPLNTYLSTKPDFASPMPLAAASGLTIPLQITLSDIRLSGFVILVFSKQKGITLVFRNDPLESLKVSSTFDTIPFVRDYLQKVIEEQLRVLFMEDLPAIIHRLSLRMFVPEFQELDTETEERLDSSNDTTAPIDPLLTPPTDAVDAFGNPIDASLISAHSLDPTSEMHASFSQKNMLRLHALSESQRTLSLFTPGIRDVVFRAWAHNSDRPDSGTTTPGLTQSSLSRIQSTFGSIRSQTSSIASGSTGQDTFSSRPTLGSNLSASTGLTLGSNRSGRGQMRKRKKRVVDLRKNTEASPSSIVSSEADTLCESSNVSSTASVIPEEREKEEELATPPMTPAMPGLRFEGRHGSLDVGEPSRVTERIATTDGLLPAAPFLADPPKLSQPKHKATTTPIHLQQLEEEEENPRSHTNSNSRPPLSHNRLRSTQQATTPLLRSLSFDKVSNLSSASAGSKFSMSPPYSAESASNSSGGILEQAWMTKMANEIARKVELEKNRRRRESRSQSPSPPQGSSKSRRRPHGGMWASDDEVDAPPAYVA
jgi:distribution and morphology protein 34